MGAIRDIEGGAVRTDVARRMGVSTQTMQRWRARVGDHVGSRVGGIRPL